MHKPPTLLVHDEIESVEFCRQGGGVLAASAKTFDLAIRTRNDQARPPSLSPGSQYGTLPAHQAGSMLPAVPVGAPLLLRAERAVMHLACMLPLTHVQLGG